MQNPESQTISAIPLAGELGAEIIDVRLADIDAEGVQQINELLVQYQVLFFPQQDLTVDEHVAFGRLFGSLENHPNLDNPFTQHPEVFELAASHGGLADEWHSDISFQQQPSVMSILNMVTCPPVGGDTLWASASAAFDALSEPLQELCLGLTALHDAAPHGREDLTAIHPVVRVHPQTGRRVLFVNEHFTRRIVEMSHRESEMLLNYLTHWIASPRFTVRYRWTEGTIAMWDNRSTQHFVLSDFSEQRVIQRVTIMGDRPEGVGAPRWQPYVRRENVGATSRYDGQLDQHLGRESKRLDSNRKQ